MTELSFQYPENDNLWLADNPDHKITRVDRMLIVFNSYGLKHCTDGPAIIYATGSKRWYVQGKLHRENGPAVEGADGTMEWWVDGKRHREDGPAIDNLKGSKHWYQKNLLHRVDGPAIILSDGTME